MPHELNAHPASHAVDACYDCRSCTAVATLIWSGLDDCFFLFYLLLNATRHYGGQSGSNGVVWYDEEKLRVALKNLWAYHTDQPWFQHAETFLSQLLPHTTEGRRVYIFFG